MVNFTDVTLWADDLVSHGKVNNWEQLLTHFDLRFTGVLNQEQIQEAQDVLYKWFNNKYLNKG